MTVTTERHDHSPGCDFRIDACQSVRIRLPTCPAAAMSDVTAQTLSSSQPLAGERVSFTGTLASMTHREAATLVEQHGGLATEHVSRQTTLLVIGEEGWPLESDGLPSVKLQHTLKWQLQGQAVRILRESEWLTVLGLSQERDALDRLHTPAMLAKRLDISVGTVRRWARQGLIRPVKTVYRLPYFSYADAVGVRKLVELIESGVSATEIQRSFETFRTFYPNVDRPLAQLHLLREYHRYGFRDLKGRLVSSTGQRLLDYEEPHLTGADVSTQVSPNDSASASTSTNSSSQERLRIAPETASTRPPDSAEEWQTLAADLADQGDLEAAISAVRNAIRLSPQRSDLHSHLADFLYRRGQLEAAAERWSMAVELDPDDIEAWTQLGCLYGELHRGEMSRAAFGEALARHPDFPDARYHLGELLHSLGEESAAREQWEAYLRLDQRGPWAEIARTRLGHITGDETSPPTDAPRDQK